MVDRKPPSLYDYWQALNIIEESVRIAKERTILPAQIESWQTLSIVEEWVKSQKERVIAHLNKYFENAELLLEALYEVKVR